MDKPYTEEFFASEECRRFSEILENELILDDNILDVDRGFSSAHLIECPDCRAFKAALLEISNVEEPNDDFSQRVVDDYFSRRRVKRFRPAVVLPLAAAMAAAAALVLILVNTLSPETPSQTQDSLPLMIVAGNLNINGAAVSKGSQLSQGQHISTREHDTLMRSGETMAIGLDARTKLGLDILKRTRIDLGLEKGVVAVHLSKGQNIDLAIGTRSARVVVTGTVFGVEVTESDSTVSVVRGSVRVESLQKPSKSVDVAAGWVFSVGSWKQTQLEVKSKHDILSLLHMDTPEPIHSPATEKPGIVSEPTIKDDEQIVRKQKRSRKSPGRKMTEGGSVEEIEVASPSDLIRSARVCRRNRDWACAVANYKKVTQEYPNRPESATVLLPLAEIELDYLNHPNQALRHYKRYYQRKPSGPLAQEALYGSCKALSRLGHRTREARALKEFLKLYPRSAYAANARSRLRVLLAEKN